MPAVTKAPASSKRALIDKANTTVVILTGLAAFVLIFSAVATKTLFSQVGYQNRVIAAKRSALSQLKADKAAVSDLNKSYDAFTSTSENVLGGNPSGTGAQDGNNAKIILDSLPSSYDYPALTNSVEAMALSQKLSIKSIVGTDDEITQSANSSSSTPQPVAMPFVVSAQGDYNSIQGLATLFEKSIRPIQVQTLEITADQDGMTETIGAQTFYQPAKTLNIKTTVVK